MKFTLSWLKDYLETEAQADEIAARLTAIGLEVENVDKREGLKAFVLAKVLTAKKHPNADKLQILSVDTGGKAPLQVVCGAPNARAGLIGVFAPPGAYIPGLGVTLSVGKIRDVESFGMMCSERELLLSDEHHGIIELSEADIAAKGAKIGGSFAEYCGLDDVIFDVSLTPNRADCASVYGIARDLAAAGLGRLRALNIPSLAKWQDKSVKLPPVKIEDTQTCLGFSLRRVSNIKNRPSARETQNRLRAAGVTVKNAAVDFGNYICLDIGQPLHMFDTDKIHGALHIRRARKGEKFTALNGKIYDLNETHCVIADDSGVISLPGLIGGAATACDAETKNVLIESAVWQPQAIARTGRELGIVSDARYRFERGVDPELMLPALDIAAARLADYCGSAETKISAADAALKPASAAREIIFPLSEVKRLTGLDVPPAEAEALLARLGFTIKPESKKAGEAALSVTAPSWRADVEGKADLVEEIIRLYGVDKITPQPLAHHYNESGKILTTLQSRTRLARRSLAARAMAEAVTYSFISARAAEMFGGGQAELKLANPIAADMSDMRPSLLPNLLSALKRNADRGFADVALFELGDVYHGLKPQEQKRMAAGVRAGTAGLTGAGRMWSGNAAPVDCFTAKADALAALESLGMAADNMQAERGAPSYFHPGRSGALKLGPKIVLGYFGELHPSAAEFFGLRGAVSAFELFLEAIPEPRKKGAKTKPPLLLSPFQPVKRDFSFIVDEDVTAAVILRAVSGADKKLISNAQVFDVFAGEGIAAGKKAVGIEVTIQPSARSLTDEELENISGKIIANVQKSAGGALR